jgi:hypothetical protein
MPYRRNDPREWSPVELFNSENATKEKKSGLCSPWQYIISNPATYPPEIFAQVSLQLILHPERNSKNIRRADILSDTDTNPDLLTNTEQHIKNRICTRIIRTRLMPRNPNLDHELEQTCRFYVAEGDTSSTLVTYHSHFPEDGEVPYYVPPVLGIAFELFEERMYIAYLPLPGTSIDDRSQRIALNLLRTIHRHWYNLNSWSY